MPENTPPTPPVPPTVPAYALPPQHSVPKSVTITFPVIKGKLAAFLYLITTLLLAVIAVAQVSMALDAADEAARYRHAFCSGEKFGDNDYTDAENEQFRELCGHAPRFSGDD